MLKINESWKKIVNRVFIKGTSITFDSIKEFMFHAYINPKRHESHTDD